MTFELTTISQIHNKATSFSHWTSGRGGTVSYFIKYRRPLERYIIMDFLIDFKYSKIL